MKTFRKPGRVLLLLLIVLISGTTYAQELATERRAVLRSHGDVDQPKLSLFPVQTRPGVVFAQPVAYPNAESLRLHFVRLDEAAADDTWEIQILQGDEVRSRITHVDLAGNSYWTDEYAGSKLFVQLHSTTSDNPIRIQISDVAVGRMAPVRLSITGENQLTAINLQEAWVQDIGKRIARLRFVADDRKIYTCTAFLVAPQLLLTNQHCIAGDTELESALVDFDYDSAIAETLFTRLKTLVANDYDLDYSIVELLDTVDRTPLSLDEAAAIADQDLLIIQHPGGQPKQVSVQDCKVGLQQVKGRGDVQSDFEHLCDTQTGSSGSPVIDRQHRLVVGLHHLGFEEDNNNLHNRAVHIGMILDDLDEALRARITGENSDNENADENQ